MSKERSENGLPRRSTRPRRSYNRYNDNAIAAEPTAASSSDQQRLSNQESDFIRSLIKKERASSDEQEGVHQMFKKIFEYVASNTKFFSSKTFDKNLEKLNDTIEDLEKEKQAFWKTSMYLVVQAHNLNQIKDLVRINGFDLNSSLGPVTKEENQAESTQEHTALTLTALKGNVSLLKSLVEEGGNPNALNSDGLAPIHFSAMESDALPVLKFLLDCPKLKADVNLSDSDHGGVSPLMIACARGKFNTAEYLLQQKASVNQQDSEGRSALFYAVKGGHIGLVKLLVSQNACVYLRDESSASVLHHLMNANLSCTAMKEILDYLVGEKGLCVSYKKKDGSTALHIALNRGLYSACQYLIDRKADLEAKRDGWETPVWTLVKGKAPSRPLVMMMLNAGANFSVKTPLGMTLIYYATNCLKNEMLVDTLVEVQKELKSRRMKEMLRRRKEIFTDDGDCLEQVLFGKPDELKLVKTETFPSVALTPAPFNINKAKVSKPKSNSSRSSSSSSHSSSSDNDSDNDDPDCNVTKKADDASAPKNKINKILDMDAVSSSDDDSDDPDESVAPTGRVRIWNTGSTSESEDEESKKTVKSGTPEDQGISSLVKNGKSTSTQRVLRSRRKRLAEKKNSDKEESSGVKKSKKQSDKGDPKIIKNSKKKSNKEDPERRPVTKYFSETDSESEQL